MSPDTPVGELNTRISRLEQRVEDLDRLVSALGPVSTQAATLAVQLSHVSDDISNVKSEVGKLFGLLDQREERVSQERRSTRTALWSLVAVLGAAIITAVGAIIVAALTGAT